MWSINLTNFSVLLGIGLLTAHRHKCFDYGLDRWTPQSIRSFSWTFYPLVIFYTLSNLFVFIMAWFPSGFQDALHKLKPTERVVPSLIAPILAVACFGFGVVYWAWDMYILRFLGYELETLQEYPDHEDALVMHMTFEVSQDDTLVRICTNRGSAVLVVLQQRFGRSRRSLLIGYDFDANLTTTQICKAAGL